MGSLANLWKTEERGKFRNALARVAVATRADLDKPTIRVYEENLQALPIGVVLSVLRVFEFRGSGFFPRLPELRGAIDEALESQEANQLYVPLKDRPAPCPRCDGTKFVEAQPTLVAEGEKPARRVVRCPDCREKG